MKYPIWDGTLVDEDELEELELVVCPVCGYAVDCDEYYPCPDCEEDIMCLNCHLELDSEHECEKTNENL